MINFNIILPSIFMSGFLTKMLYAFLISLNFTSGDEEMKDSDLNGNKYSLNSTCSYTLLFPFDFATFWTLHQF